ncbi:hypothetical protein KEM55_002785 [Ascosphaera atra]|nr:hypothetical protein KEM55_002785 [Ascosphaera atra]
MSPLPPFYFSPPKLYGRALPVTDDFMAPPKLAVLGVDRDCLRHFEHLADRLTVHFVDTRQLIDESTKVDALRDYDAVCMQSGFGLSLEVLATLPKLQLILAADEDDVQDIQGAVPTIQADVVYTSLSDEQAARSAPTPSARVQHTWGLILGLSRHIARDDAAVKRGGWQGGFGTALPGKVLGVLGFGPGGTEVARIGAVAFGMKIKTWSTETLEQDKVDAKAAAAGIPPGTVKVVSKDDLFRTADVLTIHEELSKKNVGVVGPGELAQLKKSALLVNTSRGILIDEEALFATLDKGGIKGAGLDTFKFEPLPPTSPWRITKWGEGGKSEVILTPDVAYAEVEGLDAVYARQAKDLEDWMNKESTGGCSIV